MSIGGKPRHIKEVTAERDGIVAQIAEMKSALEGSGNTLPTEEQLTTLKGQITALGSHAPNAANQQHVATALKEVTLSSASLKPSMASNAMTLPSGRKRPKMFRGSDDVALMEPEKLGAALTAAKSMGAATLVTIVTTPTQEVDPATLLNRPNTMTAEQTAEQKGPKLKVATVGG